MAKIQGTGENVSFTCDKCGRVGLLVALEMESGEIYCAGCAFDPDEKLAALRGK